LDLSARKREEAGENYIMRSSIMVGLLFNRHYSNNEMGKAYSAQGDIRKAYKILVENT
jgi:hypothetical protein